MEQKPNTDGAVSIENQLEHTQEKLNQLKAEFEEFAYTVSHDLSGPLRHASSFAEMVLESNAEVLDEKSKKFLGYIIKSANEGKRSIDLLKGYSRLNLREQVIEDEISLLDVMKSAEINLTSLIEKTEAKIEYDMLPSIRGDKDQLTQLFQCLIKNSLTYQGSKNTPIIHIKSRFDEDAWYFAIEDNGIGISDSQRDSVFKIFNRGVDPAVYIGDGMGLTLSKKIVEKHNGKIWIDPDRIEGTKVHFTISRMI